MNYHSKAARKAFKVERERKETSWIERIQESFIYPFSWTVNVRNSKYRRTPAAVKSFK
ncbi:hypothetical protein [Pantoea sp. A4]|uniref:hypothetical protein n=1 Tax=Pantoea sp. A4 TaxID=1225184 RepID=UPI000AF65D4D|nr:hypothetical protein [Pantoea sp. A4]